MENDGINTFGRSEFFKGVYPVAVLGDISLCGLDIKCTSLRQRISQDWIDWFLLGTSENFT